MAEVSQLSQLSLCQWCNQKKKTKGTRLTPFNNLRYDICEECHDKLRKNRSDELMRVQIANAKE